MNNNSELDITEAIILPFKPKVKNSQTSSAQETGLGGLFSSFSRNSTYMKIYVDSLFLQNNRLSFQKNLYHILKKESFLTKIFHPRFDMNNRNILFTNDKCDSYFRLFFQWSMLNCIGIIVLTFLLQIFQSIGLFFSKNFLQFNSLHLLIQLGVLSAWIVTYAMAYSYVESQKAFSKEILDDSQRIHRWLYNSSFNQNINLLELFKSTVNELNYKPSQQYIDRLEKRYPNANWNLQDFVQGFSHKHLYDTMDSEYDSKYGHIFECIGFMSQTEYDVSNFIYHVACNKNLAHIAINNVHEG